MSSSNESLNLFDLEDGKIRILHVAWLAFFITFAAWFNHAPLLVFMQKSLGLTAPQLKGLMILNVALTIPSRIVIGMLVDAFGPRRMYTALLLITGVLCAGFAMSQSFEQLALMRFLMGFVGAGFVVGIRLVGEWFSAKNVGIAEGIYGGWGNFGAAASAMALPALAVAFGGDDGWRYALGVTGLIAVLFAGVFYRVARDTPKGSTYFKPKKAGGIEVTSRRDFAMLIAMNVPLSGALGLLIWRLSPSNLKLLSLPGCFVAGAAVLALFAYQTYRIYQVNEGMLKQGAPDHEKYEFKQVAILSWAYFLTFGSELAVVSMLPLFFLETFTGLSPVKAGLLASSFAFVNLLARPAGGWVSDRFGRKRSLVLIVAGLGVGYLVLSRVNGHWPVQLAVVATMCCSLFVQSGAGAVFAMVPLVKRRMTGQIAGMVGAYGNAGGVCYLAVLSMVDYHGFFAFISVTAAVMFVVVRFLEEPRGHTTEVLEDGSVHLIEVS